MIRSAISSPGRSLLPPSPWLGRFAPRPGAAVRLFCFPYAGGHATTIFRDWHEQLPDFIEVAPVQLPGRATRISETPLTSIRSIAQESCRALRPYFDRPFALFGHSMGAIICFELARELAKEHGITPVHLFVSGRGAPQAPLKDPPTYNLPDEEFIAELRRINGTPQGVLEHADLLQMLLPVLRADFEVCQTYIYEKQPPLRCPITVYGGLLDTVTREEIEGWREQTCGAFAFHMLPGDHFFIKSDQRTLLSLVLRRLQSQLG